MDCYNHIKKYPKKCNIDKNSDGVKSIQFENSELHENSIRFNVELQYDEPYIYNPRNCQKVFITKNEKKLLIRVSKEIETLISNSKRNQSLREFNGLKPDPKEERTYKIKTLKL